MRLRRIDIYIVVVVVVVDCVQGETDPPQDSRTRTNVMMITLEDCCQHLKRRQTLS